MIKLEKFSISKYPVTKREWDAVRLWARKHGYEDLSVGRGKALQPVGCITWYDAVKFSNALSELAGLKPVYYDFNGNIYKNGEQDIDEGCIDKNADGYRLPTAEEWVYAARGGGNTKYFWGDNEYPDCTPYVQEFKGTNEITQEVGKKAPNLYGIYDIIGNVYEWCFDKKYGFLRTLMGGSVALDAVLMSDFESAAAPECRCYETGIRLVSNKHVLSVDEAAKKSKFYGTEEWPKAEYPDMSYKAIAQRLKKQLSDDDFSQNIKTLIDKGEYKYAFEKFRNKKFETIKAKYDGKQTVISEIARSEDELLKIKDIYDFIFFKGDFKYDVYHNLDELDYMSDRYSVTKDKKYLDCCILIIKAYIVRHKAEFDVLPDEILKERNNTPITWAWGNGFDPGKRSLQIMCSLAKIVWSMKKEEYDLFPADIFAELAISLVTYGAYPTIKDGREKITNQIAHTSNWVLSVTSVFSEFKNSELFEKIVLNRWQNGMKKTLYPDGSACEQSLDYNYGIIEGYLSIKNKINNPDNVKELSECVENISRMLTVITSPAGVNPVTAYSSPGVRLPLNEYDRNMYFDYIYKTFPEQAEWVEYDRIKNLLKNPDRDTPKFNSVFFPYGATAVIRSGWRRESQYMYFFAPRAGAGHSSEAVGDVQFQAFGRELLKTGGTDSYKLKQRMYEEQFDMIEECDRYFKLSNSRNTVLVDGKGQSRLKLTEQVRVDKYPDTAGYRWYESDGIVYVEGIYKDGYYDCNDVCHKREIIFLKKERIWIIIDRMYSEKMHTYTQNWHFNIKGEKYTTKDKDSKIYSWDLDGFDCEDIVLGENEIYTKDEKGANIFMRHFGNVRYNTHYGEKNPYAGWTSLISDNRFKYYPVEEVHCDFEGKDNTVLITILEASPNCKSRINNIKRNDYGGNFEIDNIKYSIFKNFEGRIEIRKDEALWIVLDDVSSEYFEMADGIKNEFTSPDGMHWEERSGYYVPVYEMKKQ